MKCPKCSADVDDSADRCFNCGHVLRVSTTLVRGSVIGGRYEVLALLGKGGMGMVYKARDHKLEETVAIKVLRPDMGADADMERRFRTDLYYRLNAYQVRIPPLRERREDIRPLVKKFLEKYQAIHDKKIAGITDKAKKALLGYGWPGNIRELRSTIERGVILAPHNTRIEINHLFTSWEDPAASEIGLDTRGDLDVPGSGACRALCEAVLAGTTTIEQIEQLMIDAAVNRAHGNLSSAARMLGLTRPQLAYRIKSRQAEAAGHAPAAQHVSPG